LVIRVFLSLLVLLVAFDLVLILGEESVTESYTLLVLFGLALTIICHVVAISHFPQVR